ncbi:hypothetical protein BDP27DRAFT_1369139 [Rhodocollybia butyracea]|uniref:Uncharacterized protein n=1 Tax=Rhodocollybia butyracea TaxID=206335 RepID=A0A9P5U0Q6_9AGAR|nr:hypothetical protein BDP27DRAFT_1369139 [Rhodocollybia butyracea]
MLGHTAMGYIKTFKKSDVTASRIMVVSVGGWDNRKRCQAKVGAIAVPVESIKTEVGVQCEQAHYLENVTSRALNKISNFSTSPSLIFGSTQATGSLKVNDACDSPHSEITSLLYNARPWSKVPIYWLKFCRKRKVADQEENDNNEKEKSAGPAKHIRSNIDGDGQTESITSVTVVSRVTNKHGKPSIHSYEQEPGEGLKMRVAPNPACFYLTASLKKREHGTLSSDSVSAGGSRVWRKTYVFDGVELTRRPQKPAETHYPPNSDSEEVRDADEVVEAAIPSSGSPTSDSTPSLVVATSTGSEKELSVQVATELATELVKSFVANTDSMNEPSSSAVSLSSSLPPIRLLHRKEPVPLKLLSAIAETKLTELKKLKSIFLLDVNCQGLSALL